jgi:hypothetical protein
MANPSKLTTAPFSNKLASPMEVIQRTEFIY